MPGWRQRAQAPERFRSRSPPERDVLFGIPRSVLAWLKNWGWGKADAASIARLAHVYVEDHDRRHIHPIILRLASCCSHIKNAHRVVASIVPSLALPPAPIHIADSFMSSVCLPSELLRWLRETNARRFEQHLGATPGGIQSFWEKFLERPACSEFWLTHPWLKGRSAADLRYHLPFAIFDDGVPVSEHASAYCRLFYCLLGHGIEKETRFLMGTAFSTGNDGADLSWDCIMNDFARLAGPVEAGSWGGVLLFLGSDLEYVCNKIGVPHYNGTNMCSDCEANTRGIPFHDFHDDARWRQTLVSNDRFLQRLRRPLHPLAAHIWFNKWTYRYCTLHMLDHHGCTSIIVGSILNEHVSPEHETQALPGNTIDERIEFLNSDLKGYYSFHDVANRIPRIKHSNINEGELKGNGVKGANTKALVGYAFLLQQRAVNMHNSSKQKHMFKCIESLKAIYDVLEGAEIILTDAECILLHKHCTRMGQHYQILGVLHADLHRWQSKPKLHYVVAHLASQAELINPRFVSGYYSESRCGDLAKIYSTSQNGAFHAVVQGTVLLKDRTHRAIHWRDR